MREKKVWVMNGYIGILLSLIMLGVAMFLIVKPVLTTISIVAAIVLVFIAVLILSGLVIVQPNQAMVVILFGSYLGSIRTSGLFITIPFTIRKKVSLRVRNFNSSKLKVNDVEGNPIEIAAVVVFKVVDSAKAHFDVDYYEEFVEIQSETALRHVASRYPYENFNVDGYSLRGHSEVVAKELTEELQERLGLAGVQVLEARLTHLAYSTEIASAMLQRQQADAIIAARQKIVEGAVSMVQLAVEQLQLNGLELDDERKATMVNNLMVAVVSDRSAQPVINTSSIY